MGDWLDYDFTVTPSNPTDANLIGWWNFDDGTADDNSPGGLHDGTLVTGGDGTSISIVFDADRDSNVLDVNNIADVNNSVADCGGDVNDSDPCWANLTEQVSVAAWFTLDDIHTDDQYLVTKGNTWQITSNGTSDGITSYHDVLSPTEVFTTRTVMDDKWHHVAITYDSNAPSRKMYLDGRLVKSSAPTGGPLNVHPATFVIGGRLISATFIQEGWNGQIDDVRIYDDVLTLEEVVYIMTGSTGSAYFDVYSPANLTDAGDPCDSRFVNFKDYDVLAGGWLTELLWPSGW